MIPDLSRFTNNKVFSTIHYRIVAPPTAPHAVISFGLHKLRHFCPSIMSEVLLVSHKAHIFIHAGCRHFVCSHLQFIFFSYSSRVAPATSGSTTHRNVTVQKKSQLNECIAVGTNELTSLLGSWTRRKQAKVRAQNVTYYCTSKYDIHVHVPS